jgi:hypothetical protein
LNLDYQKLLKTFKKMEKQDDEERDAAMMGGVGGAGGGGKPGNGSDPRDVNIPKVKMARADELSSEAHVIQLLEHLNGIAK